MIELAEQETSEHGILLIARFLWCMPILCPTLKQCLISLYQQVKHFEIILLHLLIV